MVGGGRTCPDPGTIELQHERFAASRAVPEHEISKLPVGAEEVEQIEVEQEAGIVEMTYSRGGAEYVVTWGLSNP